MNTKLNFIVKIGSILFFISIIMLASFFAFSIPVNNKTDEISTTGIPVSFISSEEQELVNREITVFNPEYKFVSRDRIQGYSPVIDILNGIIHEMVPLSTSYDADMVLDSAMLKNGTVFCYNTTYGDTSVTKQVYSQGANYTLRFKQDLALSGYSVIQYDGYSENIFVAYTEILSQNILVIRYNLNATAMNFTQYGNVTIHWPANMTAGLTNILDMRTSTWYSITNFVSICGYYRNASSDHIPFLYDIPIDMVSPILDDMYLNSSDTYRNYFGQAILAIVEEDYMSTVISGSSHVLLTNTRLIDCMIEGYVPYFFMNITLRESIDYITEYYVACNIIDMFMNEITDMQLLHQVTFIYSVFVIIPVSSYRTESVIAYWNSSGYTWYPVQYKVTSMFSMGTTRIGQGNFFHAITDLGRGIFVMQTDSYLNQYVQDEIVTTEPAGFFDLFMPISIDIMKSEGLKKGSILRIGFASRGSMWVAQFSDRSVDIFSIGTTHVLGVLINRAYITHDSGTKYFRYKLSGTLERNPNTADEIVEVGIYPVYVGARELFGIMIPFSTISREIYSSGFYSTNQIIGFKIIPVQNFIGFGNRFIDFSIEFDSEMLFGTVTSSLYEIVNIILHAVVYEKYANGTYSQAYLSSNSPVPTTAIASFIMSFDYDLQTTIIIQNSHLLDELHVFVGEQEFNPYNVIFDMPTMSVVVTDKYTLETLYNESSVLFADPIVLNIPSKYEFYVSYFSTLDKFGFSFDLVSTFINGTEVSTEFIRVLTPSAEIVIKDFANAVLENTTVNRFLNGSYIKIGLDIAQVIISNQYSNRTIDFYLTRGETTIYYQVPSSTSFILRLALGDYEYLIEDATTGEVLFDDTVSIGAAITLSFGFTNITPENVYLTSLIDYILYMVLFGAIIGLMVFLTLRSRNTLKAKRLTKINGNGSDRTHVTRKEKQKDEERAIQSRKTSTKRRHL